jgi:hypothetical protein
VNHPYREVVLLCRITGRFGEKSPTHPKTLGITPLCPDRVQLSSLSLRLSLLQISRHISLIARPQGTLSAILRMKVALHVIWGYLGGQRVLDTRHLGFPVQLSHGLPSFIPYRVRQAIRDGNISTIRFVTSLLYSY